MKLNGAVAALLRPKFNGPTITETIAKHGPTRGFDYLRIILAIAVILYHTVLSSYGFDAGKALLGGPFRGVFSLILPMFFSLSGFLVCGSLFRTKSLRAFLALRALRIIPALTVEVVLSAVLLGAIFTTLPAPSYFTHPQFFAYFGNIVGWIHYRLPGVFGTNPMDFVNASIWTIPFELECYIALSLIFLTGFLRRRGTLLLLVLFVSLVFPILKLLLHSDAGQFEPPPGRYLVLCFIAGTVFYLFKDKVRLNLLLCALCLAFSVATMTRIETTYWAALPVTYVTVYLGLLNPPRIPLILNGDYSYGLFLFGFPIQQTYIHLFPGFRVWWANGLFAVIFGLAFAVLSWNLVEKPVLNRRTAVIAWLDRVLAKRRRWRGTRPAGAVEVPEAVAKAGQSATS